MRTLLLAVWVALSAATATTTTTVPAPQFASLVTPAHDWLVAFVSDVSAGDGVQAAMNAVAAAYADDDAPLLTAVVAAGDAVAKYTDSGKSVTLRLFVQQLPDIECLLSPPPRLSSGIVLDAAPDNAAEIVVQVNRHLHRHRHVDGSLTVRGRKLQSVLAALDTGAGRDECEELLQVPTPEVFLRDYVLRSRPVILRGAVAHWPAISKWTNDFMRSQLGNSEVHVKLTPDGEFEGCEHVDRWPGGGSHIPYIVREQLQHPDHVVVRPAPANMAFSEFMDLLYVPQNVSAYLEYAAISSSLPQLLQDIEPPAIAASLHQDQNNIWFGNGRTVGKLHFDPFDNLLCQVSGAKHLTIYAPNENENLYEGHIAEAQLSFDRDTMAFSRETLLESTSMVMSPVDLTAPNLTQFPRFANAHALSCEIRKSDMLFLPSFWWHEVRSRPDEHKRNIAVNFWYKPILDKRFPCASCRLFVSPLYHDLVENLLPEEASPSSFPSHDEL